MLKQLFVSVILAVGLLASLTGSAWAENDIPNLFETSFGHETQGNYTAALNNVLSVLQKDKENYTATLRAGWLNYLLGKHDKAIEFYRHAVKLASGSVEAKLGIMLPYMALKQWSQAEELARTVMKVDPSNYYANSRLAWIMYSQSRYQEALEFYRKVMRMYPSDIEMQLGIGWTYLKMGKKQEARKYFSMVLSVRQSNVRALQGMNALMSE